MGHGRQALEQLQPHLGQFGAEGAQHMGQQALAHPGRHAHGQARHGAGVAQAGHFILGLGHLPGDQLGVAQQRAPGRREDNAAALALEQRKAVAFLQFAQGLGDGRLRDAQRP